MAGETQGVALGWHGAHLWCWGWVGCWGVGVEVGRGVGVELGWDGGVWTGMRIGSRFADRRREHQVEKPVAGY